MPRSHGTPMPSRCAVSCSPVGPSLGASRANAVLHELAKSVCGGKVPSASPSTFLNCRPPTEYVEEHSTGVFASACPDSSTLTAVTDLNVEPGATCAVKARLRFEGPGPLATARIEPSLTLMATIAAGFEEVAIAASAASWVCTSIVVLSGWPALALVW